MIKLKDIIPEYYLEEDENPCWKGYEMVGTKMKNGKEVPNCVPIKEEKLSEAKQGYVVADIYGGVYTKKAVSEKKALAMLDKMSHFGGDKIFMIGVEAWNKPHKMNKKKIMVKEGKLTEGKWGIKGKYLTMPGGEISSIPGPRDRDAIMVNAGRETFAIFFNLRNKLYAASDKYDKEFKNTNDLAKWLNKNKAKYIGIDNR